VIAVKRLVYDKTQEQYVIEGEPGLLVLGLTHGGLGTPESPCWFSWINGEIEDITNPDDLEEALHHEAYALPVVPPAPYDGGYASALVISLSQLAPHVGYCPDTLADGWAAVRKLVAEYWQDECMRSWRGDEEVI
jgi:hypothetical protein